MKLGIIGLPQSGKTTIFNALTRGNTPTTASAGRIDINTAVVDVPDPRLEKLSDMFSQKKTIYAKVTYVDIAGLEGGMAKSGISGQLLNQLTPMDGFIHVVRCFVSDLVPHSAGMVDPKRDIDIMLSELLLSDLIAVERKLERLADEWQKGGSDKTIVERQIKLFERMQGELSESNALRTMEFTPEEMTELSSYSLLSSKPILTVFNLGEGQTPPAQKLDHSSVALQGKLEMEIAQLPPEDASIFIQEYGIDELGLVKVIDLSYDLLQLQSFFTIGDDEVRAWALRRGGTALEAAGTVHTDMQRGFIRAEVIAVDELIAAGGLNEAKTKGKLRLEGKEYRVQDGEVIYVRFNV